MGAGSSGMAEDTEDARVTQASPPTSSGREELVMEIKALRDQIKKFDEKIFNEKCQADIGKMSIPELKEILAKHEAIHNELRGRADEQLLGILTKSTLKRPRGLSEQFDIHSADPEMLLGTESSYGLNWNNKWASQVAGPPNEEHRKKVRYGTRTKIAQEIGLKYYGDDIKFAKQWPPFCRDTIAFLDKSHSDKSGFAAAGGQFLLGRYDVVCVRAYADFDKDWAFIKDKREKNNFWVMHAAAVNIGESKNATDLADFSTQQGLDEELYIESMGHICDNIVIAATQIQAEHLIFFPFGMGAFLRRLPFNDPRYQDDFQLQRLRRRLAHRFMEAFTKTASQTTLHLCLQFDQEEALRNADAFLRAVLACEKQLRDRVTLYPEGDCLQLAHDLAKKSGNVAVVNGANRMMIGNHWFAGQAKRAMDENLHRRSWTLGALSYLLNNFGGRGEMNGEIPHRNADELERNAQAMQGRIVTL